MRCISFLSWSICCFKSRSSLLFVKPVEIQWSCVLSRSKNETTTIEQCLGAMTLTIFTSSFSNVHDKLAIFMTMKIIVCFTVMSPNHPLEASQWLLILEHALAFSSSQLLTIRNSISGVMSLHLLLEDFFRKNWRRMEKKKREQTILAPSLSSSLYAFLILFAVLSSSLVLFLMQHLYTVLHCFFCCYAPYILYDVRKRRRRKGSDCLSLSLDVVFAV